MTGLQLFIFYFSGMAAGAAAASALWSPHWRPLFVALVPLNILMAGLMWAGASA